MHPRRGEARCQQQACTDAGTVTSTSSVPFLRIATGLPGRAAHRPGWPQPREIRETAHTRAGVPLSPAFMPDVCLSVKNLRTALEAAQAARLCFCTKSSCHHAKIGHGQQNKAPAFIQRLSHAHSKATSNEVNNSLSKPSFKYNELLGLVQAFTFQLKAAENSISSTASSARFVTESSAPAQSCLSRM